MTRLPYQSIPEDALPTALGLIVLQADETLEPEFHATVVDRDTALYVSRIPSAETVTPDTLSAMKAEITRAADLLPKSLEYAMVGYGCTSASAIIGSDTVTDLIRASCHAKQVTDPLRAAIAFARHHGLTRLALLSPYIESVNAPLRRVLADHGITTNVFGSFEEPQEAKVARIDEKSIIDAGIALGQNPSVEGIFVSCTNLKTLGALQEISRIVGKPAFSSNFVLSWHMTSGKTTKDRKT